VAWVGIRSKVPLVAAFADASWAGAVAFEGRTYFSRGSRYRSYDWAEDSLNDGGSLPMFAWHGPADFDDGIDAATNGLGPLEDALYLFQGDRYVRYRFTSNRVDDGPNHTATAWKLPPRFAGGIDAALLGQDKFAGNTYFFRGPDYARYSWAEDKVDLVATLAAWKLPPPFDAGVDAACNGAGEFAGKAYFFKDDRYVRYDWAADTPDFGPAAIADAWPALTGLEDAPLRRVILYVTIDTADHRGTGSHDNNLSGLRGIASGWGSNVFVDDFWAAHLTASRLDDPHVLALYCGGSFTEWVELYRQRAWRSMTDAFCELVKATRTPTLAVCGSHQLLADAYTPPPFLAPVQHMAHAGTAPVSISNESDGTFRAPNPRIGEVGAFTCLPVGTDPILAGLTQPTFAEFHHDEVAAAPAGAQQILAPNGLVGAEQQKSVGPSEYPHAQISQDSERCQIQGLVYDVPPAGRLLYSVQFHPEVASGAAADDGPGFLRNFLDLAEQYWQQNR
jgi:GMP synthase-like glutamine amidotransferase